MKTSGGPWTGFLNVKSLAGRCGDVGARMRMDEGLLVAPGKEKNTSRGPRRRWRKATERGGIENSRERRELLVCVWFRMKGIGALYRVRRLG